MPSVSHTLRVAQTIFQEREIVPKLYTGKPFEPTVASYLLFPAQAPPLTARRSGLSTLMARNLITTIVLMSRGRSSQHRLRRLKIPPRSSRCQGRRLQQQETLQCLPHIQQPRRARQRVCLQCGLAVSSPEQKPTTPASQAHRRRLHLRLLLRTLAPLQEALSAVWWDWLLLEQQSCTSCGKRSLKEWSRSEKSVSMVAVHIDVKRVSTCLLRMCTKQEIVGLALSLHFTSGENCKRRSQGRRSSSHRRSIRLR